MILSPIYMGETAVQLNANEFTILISAYNPPTALERSWYELGKKQYMCFSPNAKLITWHDKQSLFNSLQSNQLTQCYRSFLKSYFFTRSRNFIIVEMRLWGLNFNQVDVFNLFSAMYFNAMFARKATLSCKFSKFCYAFFVRHVFQNPRSSGQYILV
jgi:hypothetical protein